MRKKHLFYLLMLLPFIGWGQEGSWNQMVKLVAWDRGAGDNFGYRVAIDGDYAVVGAYFEDEDVNGESTLFNAGSAYIFKRNTDGWEFQQKIVAPDRQSPDNFGWSVSISGEYIVVGARYNGTDASGTNMLNSAGSAYIFKLTEGAWAFQQKIVASDRAAQDFFGWSVSVSGEYIVVGAYFEDHDVEGGNTLNNSGSAYIFKLNGNAWEQQQKIVASDRGAGDNFGYSTAISGDYIVVGSYLEDEGADGEHTLANAGSAYIFKLNGNTWEQQQKIVAEDRGANDNFGNSVAIDGNYIVVGALQEDEDAYGQNTLSNAGSAYVFSLNGDIWEQQQKIVASDRVATDWFGNSVAISGEFIVVGAWGQDFDENGENMLSQAGSAYIFELNENGWEQKQKIVAADRERNDWFGFSVAVSGNYILSGAPYESQDADGENTVNGAGSVYVFKYCNVPSPVVEGTTEICSGESTVLTVEAEGEVYWYASEDSTEVLVTGNEFTTTELTETISYWVEVVNGFCISERVEVVVTVNPLPELTVGNTAVETCEGTSALLEATVTQEEHLVIWYDSPDATEWVATGAEFITPVLAENTSYWVQAYDTVTHCVSERIEIVVTVIPAPVVTIDETEVTICYGNEASLFATSPNNVIFWYANEDDEEYLYHGNLFVTPELTETTTYWVEAYNLTTGCASAGRNQVTVTVNPVPEAPVAVEVQQAEQGQTLADLEVDAEGELTWYADENLTIILPDTTPLTDGTTYYVTQTLNGCESEAVAITVEIEIMGSSDINQSEFTYYPNPVKDVLNFTGNEKVKSVQIYDLSGKLVVSQDIAGQNLVQVNIAVLTKGTYVVKAQTDKQIRTFKIVKQ